MSALRSLIAGSTLVLSLLVIPAVHAGVVTFGSGANTFQMEFVPIGSPGNAADISGDPNPAGAVSYAFNIGKFEVSRDMITKANAAGGLVIPLADMSTFGGNGANRPATGMSWFEAAQFVNWLNTSQGFQAAYNFDASGNFQLWTSAEAWQLDGENLYRHKNAHYWLPSDDEWYKAAYYDPATGTYFDYPTGSNTTPTPITSGTGAGTAVYNQDFGVGPGPTDITNAGGLSKFGTMAQGGNVSEWLETAFDGGNNAAAELRVLRGGGWFDSQTGFPDNTLSSLNRLERDPAIGAVSRTIRVASAGVPEPGSLVIWGSIGLGWVLYRRRPGTRT